MGYMQIKWLFGYTYTDTTYLLTDAIANVNRPYVLVDWGVKIDTSKLVQTTITNNGILKKYHGTACTYSGPGFHNISCQNSFRIANIKNISQSDNQSTKLSTLLSIQTFGSPLNSAPIFQNKNMTLSVQNDSVIFKPQFYDPEGDSLSYQLTPCFAANYYTPNGVSIDSYGNVAFSKDSLGIYAFSIIVKEWRKNDDSDYVLIQSSQLDFTINITSDVSTKELKNELHISLYPNPTNSSINITTDQDQFQNAIIQIKNPLGQTVYTSPFSHQIDVSDFSPGIYFLTIEDRTNRKTVKIIKE